MTGDSRWNCPKCRVKRDAVKRIVIWKLPPIIIIVLKRWRLFQVKLPTKYYHSFFWLFRFYFKGYRREKISTSVDFPLTNLDLNRYVSGPHKRRPYKLFAVSVRLQTSHFNYCLFFFPKFLCFFFCRIIMERWTVVIVSY